MSNGATPNPSVPKAVPDSVVSSADNSVQVLTAAQLGPYQPQTGSSINPKVPRTEVEGEIPGQPHFEASWGHTNPTEVAGSMGAPSVPTDGFLFRQGPADPHYMVQAESRNPYARVNAPETHGWNTRVQSFANNAAHSAQDVSNTGWRVRPGQQRTSVMLNALPPVGIFGAHWFRPQQQPQAVNYNKIRPATGTDRYGTGVLNADGYGAGQTAGGIGGSNYTPSPGPPATNSVTNTPAASEPTWG